MARTVSQLILDTVKAAGVQRIYGLPGDSLNGFTEALRRDGTLEWVHVRHEESAAFAAGAEAALTGNLAVCAASCGPGNLHLINGLFDAHRSRVPVLAIASHIPSAEIGSGYFQETHPQNLFAECSVYSELVSSVEQLPYVLDTAIRAALDQQGVAVLTIPGDILSAKVDLAPPSAPLVAGAGIRLPGTSCLERAVRELNGSNAITILAGAGCEGAHAELLTAAHALQAPIVHTLRGKEFVEYDNPFDVGMTGLLGFRSGYDALEDTEVLLMLGTDFPYRQFYPPKATVIQVDIRGEHIGRRTRCDQTSLGAVDEIRPGPDFPPFAVIWGDSNLGLSPRAGRALNRTLQPDREEFLTRCGHLPMMESPEEVTAIITEFIARPPARRSGDLATSRGSA
ncbi:Probable pyruvate dehydrogenase [Mycobacteroides abscessus]|nr:Probable pyruvate dehydrogenase [Mycobacteroides abscessus]